MTQNKFSADTAIIGGTGLYQLDGFKPLQQRQFSSRWGDPSSALILTESNSKRVIFLARHGFDHNIAPHRVNYRANLWALKECGVKRIIAVAAVGGITDAMSPETVVLPHQILDYTYGRGHTFFEEDLQQVTHIDFTEPYSQPLRQALIQSASQLSMPLLDSAVYAATQGPRLETAAEIERLKRDGADIVGMTGMPEAALARELGLDYACCALVVNWAAGCAGTRVIDHGEMLKIVDKGMGQVKSLLADCL